MGEDFRLGDWLVQPGRDCIQRDEAVVHLKPKAMAVLVRLAAAGGGVVTRDELFESVWPGAVVSDAALTQCVVELRHAFGDSARNPEIIETVPKVGFRLMPLVCPIDVGRLHESGQSATFSGPPEAAARGVSTRNRLPWSTGLAVAMAFAIVVIGVWAYSLMSVGPTPPALIEGPDDDVKSLAVLPFDDLSEDRSQGWFADGMAEEVRTGLIRLRGLQVAGDISSARLGSEPDDLRAAAESLGVQYLLLGSVRRANRRLRVTARLVDAGTGFHLWSETFDRPQADIFDVQAEIAESVAIALSITLGVGDLGNAPGGTNSFEAYELTLRARERYQAFTPESVMDAVELLQRAVEIDPDYTGAWATMAVFLGLAPIASDESAAIDWLARSQEALDEAGRLEPDLSALLPIQLDLHMARGEWAQLETRMNRASEADVALLPDVHFSYGIFLAKMGRAREALAYLRHARQLEPLAPDFGSKLGHVYLLNGRIGEALAEHDRVWQLGTGNRYFQSSDGLHAALAGGDRKIVTRWLTRVIEHTTGHRNAGFSTMRLLLDDPQSAVAWLRDASSRQSFDDFWISVFAAYFGNSTLALDTLSRSPDAYAIWTPYMADVRRQPGFKDLVRKLGLPEYWREFAWGDFCRPVGEDDFTCE